MRKETVNTKRVCSRCGKEDDGRYGGDIVRHHILPLSQGGEDEESNTEYLCLHCHGLVHYWTGKIDDPPRRRSDKAIRLSIEIYQALDSYRITGESFNEAIRRLLLEVSRDGEHSKSPNQG